MANYEAIELILAELELLREIEQKRTRVMPGQNCEICGYANHSKTCPYSELDYLRNTKGKHNG